MLSKCWYALLLLLVHLPLGATQPFRPFQLFIDVPPFGCLQIFEAPPASIPAEEQDDLLFFVYLEAYQVHLAAHTWHEQSLIVQLDLTGDLRTAKQ